MKWPELERRYGAVLEYFPGEGKFLRYLYEVEAVGRWVDPQLLFAHPRPSRARIKSLERRATIVKDYRASNGRISRYDEPRKTHRKLSRLWYGRAIAHPARWCWFSALVPYLTWKKGELDWAWLASWVEAIEGDSPRDSSAEDRVRLWWSKTVRTMDSSARAVSSNAHLIGESKRVVSPRRALGRHLALMRLFDGAWAYVRFNRQNRRVKPIGDITEFFPEALIAKSSLEREFVTQGLIKTFKFFRAVPVRERNFADYREIYLSTGEASSFNPIPSGYLEVLPRV